MANSINLIAFGTFGNPNGFKQTFFVGNKDIAKAVKTFDLNTNAIKLFANSKVFSIRKEYANGFNTIAYSIYTYAKEQNSDRSGTFIGSSILFTNKIAKEHITISQLNEFHSQLVSKNVENHTILVNHSDKFSVVKPHDFDNMAFHLREIDNLNFKQNTENNLVVFCNISDVNIKGLFEKAIDLLNVYDVIYFTDSKEVAEFVYEKGVFKLSQNVGEKRDFEREVNNFIEDRKRKREQSISEFEKDVLKIREHKDQTIQDFKSQIDLIEKAHFENERRLKESKEEIRNISQFYDDFLNKSKNLIHQLKHSNLKLDEVKQIYNSNKILFNKEISNLKQPNYITAIAKPKPRGNLPIEQLLQDFDHNDRGRKSNERQGIEEEDFKINTYKVVSLILVILLVFTWVYFLFLKSNSENPTETIKIQQDSTSVTQQIPVKHEITKIEDLSPISNSKLNENDYKIIAKNLSANMSLDEVVKVIFNKNPSEISNLYTGQETIYSKHLLELNRHCFEEKDGKYYFVKDTLKQIPSYKK